MLVNSIDMNFYMCIQTARTLYQKYDIEYTFLKILDRNEFKELKTF